MGLSGTISLDGGDHGQYGSDYLIADFSDATNNITFVFNGAGIWSTFRGQGSRIKNFEEVHIRTGSGNDRLIGNDYYTTLYAGAGNDYVDGRGGRDEINGGDGDDRLFGASGDDSLYAGAGNDFLDGGEGVDEVYGEAGIDTISYASAGAGVLVTFREEYQASVSGGGGRDSIEGFERIVGSQFADTLTGDSIVNYMDGAAGDDVLTGRLGLDTILGGSGSDSLDGGAGADRLSGGAGVDTLTGDVGDDRLEGGDASDTLLGGDGADILIGGQGRDLATGGAGLDLFRFGNGDTSANRSQADTVADFSRGDGDRIDLRGIDANTSSADVDDRFSFLGTGAFTGAAGQLRYAQVEGDTYVHGDINGDKVADFYVRVDGLVDLVAADFVL